MKKRQKIADIFLLLLVFYLAFYITFDIINPRLTVKYMGYKTYIVMSESMKPKINVGDIVFVKKHDISKLKVNDIIAFTPRRGLYVTHILAEIREINSEYLLRTRTFSNVKKEKWDYWTLREDDYIGKSVIIIPFIGNIFLFLRTTTGIITFVLSVIILIMINKVLRKKTNG